MYLRIALPACLVASTVLAQSASQQIPLPLPLNLGGTGAASATSALSSLGAAPLANPTFTGTVTASILDLSGVTGSTQCLQASSTGVISGTGAACGSGGGSMVYPGAGVPNSTGSAWGASYGVSGTGSVALTTSPTFTTPNLGAATATTINGNTLTTGSSTYTGTAGQTYTFPTTTATIARTDAGQTFSGTNVFGTVQTGTIKSNTGHIVDATVAPTVSSGFGTSPTVATNGSFAFTVTIGSSPGTTGVVAMNTTVTNGWVCVATDYTTPSEQVRETTYSTTVPGFTFYNWAGTATPPTAADVVGFQCRGN